MLIVLSSSTLLLLSSLLGLLSFLLECLFFSFFLLLFLFDSPLCFFFFALFTPGIVQDVILLLCFLPQVCLFSGDLVGKKVDFAVHKLLGVAREEVNCLQLFFAFLEEIPLDVHVVSPELTRELLHFKFGHSLAEAVLQEPVIALDVVVLFLFPFDTALKHLDQVLLLDDFLL